MSPKRLVERFYLELWNNADDAVALEILDENFSFAGPFGVVEGGREGFIAYMHSIHEALSDFQCSIEDLICEDDKVSTKMRFKATHNSAFFGIDPTGKQLEWSGVSFLKTSEGRLIEVWALGDIDSVKRQLCE